MVTALAVMVAALALAACGSSSNGGGGGGATGGGAATGGGGGRTTAQKDPKIAGEVPAAVRKKGTLTIATDATYPPIEFTKPGAQKQVIGVDPDLAHALAGVTGLEVKVQNATFDSIIPGLAAGKYDLGMSAFTDTKEREKTVDFVTYFNAGTSFYTKAQGGANVQTLADLCGHKVAVEKGTTQADDSQAQSKKCTASGKKPVQVLVFPDQNGANLALSSGRADVGMADSPVAAYIVKQSKGQFKVVGQTYGQAPYGIAVPKKSGLQKPLRDALQKLIQGGQYKQILSKWGVQAGAIQTPQINAAKS